MRLLKFVLLTSLVTGCVMSRTRDPSETPKTAKQALLNGVGVFDGHSKVPPADALADLEDFEHGASLKEQQLIDELLPVLDRLREKGAKIDQSDYRTVLSVMDRMTLLYPDDFDLQLRLTQSMAAVEKTLGPGVDGSGVTNARLLAHKFADQARAHELLGRLTVASDGPVIEALRAYARCLELEPSNGACKDGFKTAAKAYTQPKCTQFHKDRFSLNAAIDKPDPKSKLARKKITVNGQTLFMEKTPAVTGLDVDEIVATGTGQDQGVDIILSPKGAARFADLTARLAAEKGYLVISFDGKPKGAPKVMSAIDSGRLRMSGEKINLKRLCKKMEAEKLPADLVPTFTRLN